MPKEYTSMRDALKRAGKSDKTAKRIAAATFNKRHPGHPLRPEKKGKRGT